MPLPLCRNNNSNTNEIDDDYRNKIRIRKKIFSAKSEEYYTLELKKNFDKYKIKQIFVAYKTSYHVG